MLAAAAAAASLQSCPTRCDPIDSSPTGSPIPGILQARALEWVAISFSDAWKWKEKVKLLSCVRLIAEELKNIVTCIPWVRIRTIPQDCTIVSWLFLPCLCIPSLLWLATVWTCPLELRESHGDWSLFTTNKEHRKASVPRNSTGFCLVSRGLSVLSP